MIAIYAQKKNKHTALRSLDSNPAIYTKNKTQVINDSPGRAIHYSKCIPLLVAMSRARSRAPQEDEKPRAQRPILHLNPYLNELGVPTER